MVSIISELQFTKILKTPIQKLQFHLQIISSSLIHPFLIMPNRKVMNDSEIWGLMTRFQKRAHTCPPPQISKAKASKRSIHSARQLQATVYTSNAITSVRSIISIEYLWIEYLNTVSSYLARNWFEIIIYPNYFIIYLTKELSIFLFI